MQLGHFQPRPYAGPSNNSYCQPIEIIQSMFLNADYTLYPIHQKLGNENSKVFYTHSNSTNQHYVSGNNDSISCITLFMDYIIMYSCIQK